MSMFTYYKISHIIIIEMIQWFANLHQTVNLAVFFFKIIKIPTQKGEHSCKCTELSPKRKEGINVAVLIKWCMPGMLYLLTYIAGNRLLKSKCLLSNRSPCSFFRKLMLNKPTFANKFDYFWIVSYSHLLSPCVVTKH